MTDREKLAEIMARAVYERTPIRLAKDEYLGWDDLDEDARDDIRRSQRAAIHAAEAAGWQIVPPDDGR